MTGIGKSRTIFRRQCSMVLRPRFADSWPQLRVLLLPFGFQALCRVSGGKVILRTSHLTLQYSIFHGSPRCTSAHQCRVQAKTPASETGFLQNTCDLFSNCQLQPITDLKTNRTGPACGTCPLGYATTTEGCEYCPPPDDPGLKTLRWMVFTGGCILFIIGYIFVSW